MHGNNKEFSKIRQVYHNVIRRRINVPMSTSILNINIAFVTVSDCWYRKTYRKRGSFLLWIERKYIEYNKKKKILGLSIETFSIEKLSIRLKYYAEIIQNVSKSKFLMKLNSFTNSKIYIPWLVDCANFKMIEIAKSRIFVEICVLVSEWRKLKKKNRPFVNIYINNI